MTPNAIEVLLHYHVSPAPHPRSYAPAVRDATVALLNNGLLELAMGDGCYGTTLCGRLHVKQLCETAWPVSVFMGADGKILEPV